MNYTRLSIKDKHQIEALLKTGMSIRGIARQLGRSPNTISRELNRCQNGYDAEMAHQIHCTKRQSRYKNINEKYDHFIEYVEKYFDKKTNSIRVTIEKHRRYNPEKPRVSFQSFYNWIKVGKVNIKRNMTTYKKHRKGIKNGMMSHFKWNFDNKTVLPIALRPKYIESRNEIGHVEIDSVIGKRNEMERLITIADRATRMFYTIKAEYSHEHYINKLIYDFIIQNKIEVKSITVDNGLEFNALGIAAKRLGVKLYKCDPYCSFQRGTNERANAILRRFIPKGESVKNVYQPKLDQICREINSMPRQIFNFKSANEQYIIMK